nr:MAG TPA: hypothetical protein [Caudoviricetes sp.]
MIQCSTLYRMQSFRRQIKLITPLIDICLNLLKV